jgi:hypothetical protein
MYPKVRDCPQSSSCFIHHRLRPQVLRGVHRQLTARRSHSRAGAQSERFITNVPRGVQVTIDQLAAHRTRPSPICQCQIGLIATAAVVEAARWIEAIHLHHLSTIPGGFVAELPMLFAKRGVRERAGQPPSFEHACDVQVFKPKHRRLPRQPGRELVKLAKPLRKRSHSFAVFAALHEHALSKSYQGCGSALRPARSRSHWA